MASRWVFAARHTHAASFAAGKCDGAGSAGGGQHRMLDDRAFGDAHRASRGGSRGQRDFADGLRRDTADSGDEARQPTRRAFEDGEEPRVTSVVAHLLTSVRRAGSPREYLSLEFCLSRRE